MQRKNGGCSEWGTVAHAVDQARLTRGDESVRTRKPTSCGRNRSNSYPGTRVAGRQGLRRVHAGGGGARRPGVGGLPAEFALRDDHHTRRRATTTAPGDGQPADEAKADEEQADNKKQTRRNRRTSIFVRPRGRFLPPVLAGQRRGVPEEGRAGRGRDAACPAGVAGSLCIAAVSQRGISGISFDRRPGRRRRLPVDEGHQRRPLRQTTSRTTRSTSTAGSMPRRTGATPENSNSPTAYWIVPECPGTRPDRAARAAFGRHRADRPRRLGFPLGSLVRPGLPLHGGRRLATGQRRVAAQERTVRAGPHGAVRRGVHPRHYAGNDGPRRAMDRLPGHRNAVCPGQLHGQPFAAVHLRHLHPDGRDALLHARTSNGWCRAQSPRARTWPLGTRAPRRRACSASAGCPRDNKDSIYTCLNNINDAEFRHFDLAEGPAGHDNFNYLVSTWQHTFNEKSTRRPKATSCGRTTPNSAARRASGPSMPFGGGGGNGHTVARHVLRLRRAQLHRCSRSRRRTSSPSATSGGKTNAACGRAIPGTYTSHAIGLTHNFNSVLQIRPEIGYYRNWTEPAFDLGTKQNLGDGRVRHDLPLLTGEGLGARVVEQRRDGSFILPSPRLLAPRRMKQ